MGVEEEDSGLEGAGGGGGGEQRERRRVGCGWNDDMPVGKAPVISLLTYLEYLST